MDFVTPFLDQARKWWDGSQSYLAPGMILLLLFLGPVVCKFAASKTRSFDPWLIKLVSLVAASGAMVAANLVLYKLLANNFAWCAWLPDLLFVTFVLGWLFTPLLQLRAGSADALDDKIERRRSDGWNALVFRWIPSTGVHRVLLTKRVARRTTRVVLPPGARTE